MNQTEKTEVPFYTQNEMGVDDERLAKMAAAFAALKTGVETLRQRLSEATLARGNRPPKQTGEELNARDHALWVAIDRLEMAKAALHIIVPALIDSMWDVRCEIDPSLHLKHSPLFQHKATCWRIQSNLACAAGLREEAAELFFKTEDWLLQLPEAVRKDAEKGMKQLYYGSHSHDRKYVIAFGKCGEPPQFLNGSDTPPPPPYMTLAEAKDADSRWAPFLTKDPGSYSGVFDVQSGRFIARTSDQR